MVKQQLRVLCFINYSHLPSSGGEGATRAYQIQDISGLWLMTKFVPQELSIVLSRHGKYMFANFLFNFIQCAIDMFYTCALPSGPLFAKTQIICVCE